MACFCVIFSVYGCMFCLVRYLFIISTSVIDCLWRFVPEMTYYVSSGTLNLTKLKLLCRTQRMATIGWNGGSWLVTITSCRQWSRTWLSRSSPTWSSRSSRASFILACQLLILMLKVVQGRGQWCFCGSEQQENKMIRSLRLSLLSHCHWICSYCWWQDWHCLKFSFHWCCVLLIYACMHCAACSVCTLNKS